MFRLRNMWATQNASFINFVFWFHRLSYVCRFKIWIYNTKLFTFELITFILGDGDHFVIYSIKSNKAVCSRFKFFIAHCIYICESLFHLSNITWSICSAYYWKKGRWFFILRCTEYFLWRRYWKNRKDLTHMDIYLKLKKILKIDWWMFYHCSRR